MDDSDESALRSALAWLEERPGLRLALLFGSAARGALRPESDLDVAVLADRPLAAARKHELIRGLAEASGRPVDLVDLASVGEPLLGRILAEGRRLFGSDDDFAALVVRHLFEQADFVPLQQRILEERRRAWLGQ